MKFWCFHFEGVFTKDCLEYSEEGVFSSCLIFADNYDDAKSGFSQALIDKKIDLIEVSEHFPVDTDDIDLEDEENLYWIKRCEETKMAGKATFESFELYPKDEVPERA